MRFNVRKKVGGKKVKWKNRIQRNEHTDRQVDKYVHSELKGRGE